MSTLFISDLHLSKERPHITAAFFAFLNQHILQPEKKLPICDRLYILGDFFDAWIGDDDESPLMSDVADELQKAALGGTQIFFQHGNRDFLLGEQYAARCGMTLLPELFVWEHQGERCLLAHGDQFCTADTDYQQFRSLVRNPAWQSEILSKPLTERRAIAAQMRAESRDATSIKAESITDVTQSEIEQALLTHHCKRLIHGHTHRPARHAIVLPDGTKAERLVLGEWADNGFCRIK
jgi:UDP-2,3-diacylglucosamine hydrolase